MSKVYNTHIDISIIIPIYNVEDYLEACLNSILPQIGTNVELILINDHSSDKSEELTCQLIKGKTNIRLINNEKNFGLSKTRNIGIKAAKGEYLIFIDSDDYISKDFIKSLFNSIKSNNTDVAIAKTEKFLDKNGCHHVYSDKYFDIPLQLKKCNLSETLGKKINCCAWNKIYRKEIIIKNKILFPEGLLNEDELFWRLYCLYAKTISFSSAIYFYRQRTDGIMGTIKKSNQDNLLSKNYYKIFKLYYLELVNRSLLFTKKHYATSLLINSAFETILRTRDANEKQELYTDAINFIRLHNIGNENLDQKTRRLYFQIINKSIGTPIYLFANIVSKIILSQKDIIKIFGIVTAISIKYKPRKTVYKLFDIIPIYVKKNNIRPI